MQTADLFPLPEMTRARAKGHAMGDLAAEKTERVVDPEWCAKAVEAPNYRVSRDGQVFRIDTGRKLTQWKSNSGYSCVNVWHNNKGASKFVHRLVADAFVAGKTDEKRYVNHIDGNRLNNDWRNLEWCTASENAIHAVYELKTLTPPVMSGTDSPHHRPVRRIDPKTGESVCFTTMSEAASTGFDIRGIYAACCGEQKTHYGYRWQYMAEAKTKCHNRAGAVFT